MRAGSSKHLTHGKVERLDTTGVLLEGAAAGGIMDFAAVFGSDRPLEVEVGTGKGSFLLARAKARPEMNFLGVECARAYCLYAADRFRRHGLTNVRMLRADAGHFFETCVGDGSVWRVHVYFPDPWPKRRHHDRRLIQPPFIAQVRRTLRVGGELIIVTDHMGYYEQIRSVLLDCPGLAAVPPPRMGDAEAQLTGTNFQRKYLAQGRTFYSAARLKYT